MILFINNLIIMYEYHYCTGKCVNNDMRSIRILEDILEVIEKEREKECYQH